MAWRAVLSAPAARAAALAALALVAAGCSAPAQPHLQAELRSGPYALIVDEGPRVLLTRGNDTLLAFEADAFRLGLVAPVDDDTNYDPYRLYVQDGLYHLPSDPLFIAPESSSLAGGSEHALNVALAYPDGRGALLAARDDGDGRFALTLTPTAGAADVAFVTLRAHVSASEGFYGLGELTDAVNQRGKIRAMQLEVDPETEAGYNDAHAPVPFLIGTRGWGMFVASRRPGAFAVAADVAAPDIVEASFGVGTAAKDGLAFHLFAAEHPLDVTRRFYDVTGKPGLPARWALGPWTWRDESKDQAEVEADADAIRDLDLATTGYWIDRPYATGVNTFDFDARFPNPHKMLGKLRDLGLRTALWHTPYLDEKDPSTAALRAEATNKGFYPPEHGLGKVLNKWGTPLDLTNPAAVAWWRDHLRAYTDLGVEGFKLDYAEDVVLGLNAARIRWKFADGSDERTQHAEYQLHYHDTYAGVMPAGGGFLLTRAARWGDHVHGMVMWPGDLDASFARHGDTVKDASGGSYVATGGLPASIVCGLTLGPIGYPFYAADTGGYRHSPPDNELFSRWFEQSALSSAMEIGTSSNDVAWQPTPANGFDAALLARYRQYVRLHLRLWPYVWSYALRLADDGRPIMRALGLAHPELGVHPNDEYLLGDELLVAPVVERGKTERAVIFPRGQWVHWFTGEIVDGTALAGQPLVVAAPIGRLPLYLRAGGLVPMLRPTVDSLSPTTDPTRVDSYATDPGVVYVRAVAGSAGKFALFDGGTLSASAGATTTLGFSAGNELAQGALFELLAAAAPKSVTGTAQPDVASVEAKGGWYYDAAARTLWVAVAPAAPATVTW